MCLPCCGNALLCPNREMAMAAISSRAIMKSLHASEWVEVATEIALISQSLRFQIGAGWMRESIQARKKAHKLNLGTPRPGTECSRALRARNPKRVRKESETDPRSMRIKFMRVTLFQGSQTGGTESGVPPPLGTKRLPTCLLFQSNYFR